MDLKSDSWMATSVQKMASIHRFSLQEELIVGLTAVAKASQTLSSDALMSEPCPTEFLNAFA